MTRLPLQARLVFTALLLLPTAAQARAPLTGPLADYVAAPDDSFHWVKRTEGSVLTCKYVELTLTYPADAPAPAPNPQGLFPVQ